MAVEDRAVVGGGIDGHEAGVCAPGRVEDGVGEGPGQVQADADGRGRPVKCVEPTDGGVAEGTEPVRITCERAAEAAREIGDRRDGV